MAGDTKIDWTDKTFSPWIGCTRVSPGCRHCYAEAQNNHWGWVAGWGPKVDRRRTAPSTWKQPMAWNREAGRLGIRYRVFPSLCDPFDDHPSIKPEWRADFWQLIRDTPNLIWQILTKRPENWPTMMPTAFPDNLPNIRLGCTMEDQERYLARIDDVISAHEMGWPTFVSLEPLLGPIAFDPGHLRHIRQMLVGGESGSDARICNIGWIRSIVRQCRGASVPVFVKQLGALALSEEGVSMRGEHRIFHPKGGDPAEWPEDLRVREAWQ
jgi:protein gp37